LSPFFEIEYFFTNYRQYLLDYPSQSEDDDSGGLDENGSAGGEEQNDRIVDPKLVLEESDSYSSTDGNMQEG
jgi:hypothetical protein